MFRSQMKEKAWKRAGESRGLLRKKRSVEYLDDSLCAAAPENANGDRDGKKGMNGGIKGKKSEGPGMMLPHEE